MIRAFVALALGIAPAWLFAQRDPSGFFDDNSFSLLNLGDHFEVEFKWTLKGKLQAFMNEGLNEYREGKHERAIYNFNEVIRQDSTFWPVYYYRGVCKKNYRDLIGAESDLKRATTLNPGQPQPYLELGELYQAKREDARARDQYERAIEKQPSFVQGYYLLGNLALSRKEEGRAIKNFEKCIELDPLFPGAYCSIGIAKFRPGKNTNDTRHFDTALEVDSLYSPALFYRGLILAGNNQLEEALVDWNRLVALNPTNPFFRVVRAYLYIEMEWYDDAFTDFTKAINSQETDENMYLRGRTQLDQQIDLQNATLYLFRKGYGLNEKAFNLVKTAYCQLLIRRERMALESLNGALAIEPSSSAYYLKGIVFEKVFLKDSAIVNYRKALQLDNEIFDAHKKLAIYHFDRQDWKGAYAELAQMKILQPKANVSYRLGGMLKSRNGDNYGAIVDLGIYLKTNPDDAEALYTLGFSRGIVKDYKGAIENLKACITVDSSFQNAYVVLSELQSLEGDSAAAFVTVRKMYALWKNEHSVKVLMADMLIRFEKYDSANLITKKILKDAETNHYLNYKANKSDGLFLMAKIFAGTDQPGKGLSSVTESLKLAPGIYERQFFRAKILIRMGKIEDAKKDLLNLKLRGYKDASDYYARYLE